MEWVQYPVGPQDLSVMTRGCGLDKHFATSAIPALGTKNCERERVAEWLRRLTHKPKVRTAVGSNPTLDSLVAVCITSPGRPEPCEGNLVAVAGSCGGLMVKHPWPLLEISLSDFRGLATLNINTYLPNYNFTSAAPTCPNKSASALPPPNVHH